MGISTVAREACKHFLGNILSAAQVGNDRTDSINGPPRYTPPSQQQRKKRVAEAFADRTFTRPNKVDIACSPKRNNEHRYAIWVDDKLRPALQFHRKLVPVHPFNPRNFHGAVLSFVGAWRTTDEGLSTP